MIPFIMTIRKGRGTTQQIMFSQNILATAVLVGKNNSKQIKHSFEIFFETGALLKFRHAFQRNITRGSKKTHHPNWSLILVVMNLVVPPKLNHKIIQQ